MVDATKIEKWEERSKKLKEATKAQERRSLHRRIKNAQARLTKLQGEDEKDESTIKELQEKLSGLRGDLKKAMADGGRKSRKNLRRVQRKITEEIQNNQSLEEKQGRIQKLSDHVGKLSTDFQKTLTKGQINAYDHSLRKKVKSLTRRLKQVGRRIEAQKKKKPPAPPAPKSEDA